MITSTLKKFEHIARNVDCDELSLQVTSINEQ